MVSLLRKVLELWVKTWMKVHISILCGLSYQPTAGVNKLKEFQAQFAELEKERQELVNAEKLFDLPITLYSDLIDVDNQLQGMAKVFELYEAQRVSEDDKPLY